MKKIVPAVVSLAFCVLALPALVSHSSKAAGSTLWPHVKLTASAPAVAANGSSTITITANFYIYECNSMYNGQYYTVDDPAYCNNQGGLRGEVLFTNYGSPCPYNDTITVDIGLSGDATLSKTSVCGGATGSDTFTIRSTVVGTKTLTPTTRWTYSGSTLVGSGVSVSFITPAAVIPTPAPKKATTPAPTPATPAPTPPPQAPTLSSLTAGGTTIKTDQAVSVEANKPLVLSGKTVANGKVALYVFSEPKQFTTSADKDGNWSVTVNGLPIGSHHAEIEVTDPATNQTSARTKLLEFSVVAAKKPTIVAATAKQSKSSKASLWIGLVVAFMLLCGLSGFMLWKHKKSAKKSDQPQQPTSPEIT